MARYGLITNIVTIRNKNNYKSYDDINYQHDSRILLFITDSNTNKYNTQATNRQHFHNNIIILSNRSISPGVWSKRT